MDFLRRLLGGGGAASGSSKSAGDPAGIYFYVQPKGCDEVVKVRIDGRNDLSQSDEGGTYFVRKSVRGVKCHQTAELYVEFDGNRRLKSTDVQQGTLVDAAAYAAWSEAQAEHEQR